jgi:hypothetical protein
MIINNKFDLTLKTNWIKSSDGLVSAIGTCTTTKTSFPYPVGFFNLVPPLTVASFTDFFFDSANAQSPGFIRQTCTENNCNNVLICYVG